MDSHISRATSRLHVIPAWDDEAEWCLHACWVGGTSMLGNARLVFVGVGVMRWPLLWVMGALAPWAVLAAWKEQE